MKKNIKLLLIFLLIINISTTCYSCMRKRDNRPYLTVIGYVQMADGIGRQAYEVINALKEDMTIGFISTRAKGKNTIPRLLKNLCPKRFTEMGKVVLFEEVIYIDGQEHYKKLKTSKKEDQIRIAYSMFESTALPDEWPLILNTYFDAVAVPDRFLIDVYKKCGVTIPIFELPLGLDLGPFLRQPLKKERSSPMVFANFSSCISRKNQLMLIRSFAKAFGNSPDVVLKINCRYAEKGLPKQIEEEIQKLGLTNVQFTELTLDSDVYLKTFETIDCYVSLSKGEGFSIQPREAMALGIPVIVTDNTGQTTICKSGLVSAVPSNIEEPAVYLWGRRHGNDFNCKVDDVVAALKEMKNNYEKHLEDGPKAREWVSQYQYDNMRPLYVSLIKPKEVILGDEDKVTTDYLMTTSQELYDKYKTLK